MNDALIQYQRGDDGIATITLNDPPGNTHSYEMMRQLDAAILDAREGLSAHLEKRPPAFKGR